jgi:hypothetical protein
VVNVGGVDIVDGRKKMMLSLIWQMIHISIVKLLETLGRSQGITTITEEVIVGWANRKVIFALSNFFFHYRAVTCRFMRVARALPCAISKTRP